MKVFCVLVVAFVCQALAEAEKKESEGERSKRSVPSYHRRGGSYGHQGYGERRHGYVETHKVVEKKYYKPKQCYQCAYSPPKTYYDKKVYVEQGRYQKHYNQDKHQQQGYGHNTGYGGGYHGGRRGYEDNKSAGKYGGYTKKTVVPVPFTVYGGWDKCIGPFTQYEAKNFGVDEWDCHSNCYTRRDPNGDVFRGCYKGEYGVDPHRVGCSKQNGSIWCFCEGDKCNNGPSPAH